MTATGLMLIGAGGGVHDVLDIVDALNAEGGGLELVGLLDDHSPAGLEHLGLTVLGSLASAARFRDVQFVNTIANERDCTRLPEIIEGTGLAPGRFATLIHPSAAVSRRAEVGCGVVIAQGVSVGGGVVLRDHVALGPNVVVGHDAVIDAHAVIAAGAVVGGWVHVGGASYIGTAASIRPHVAVGRRSLVGLGAAVVRDVPAASTVVGNPAHPLIRRDHRSGEL
jgi:sugar O-acyltransferase (sialic acid O-acetyltransferase NeuD family)